MIFVTGDPEDVMLHCGQVIVPSAQQSDQDKHQSLSVEWRPTEEEGDHNCNWGMRHDEWHPRESWIWAYLASLSPVFFQELEPWRMHILLLVIALRCRKASTVTFSCSNNFRSFARMQMKIFKIGFCTNNNTQILIVLKLFQIIFSKKKNGFKENKRERMV